MNDFRVPGPEVSAADSPLPQYSVETLAMAVVAGSVAALMVGFVTGYFCGRKCHKEEEDNLPYPDTEYEYFEQRQTVNRYCIYFLVFQFCDLLSTWEQLSVLMLTTVCQLQT
jgi:semaphorin 6